MAPMADELGDVLGTLTLPPALESSARARRFVEQTLEGRVEDLAAVVLMTSELVTNVAMHAATELTMTLRSGPPIRVEVHDGVAATETFRDLVNNGGSMPHGLSPGGRGLHLVRLLSSRVGLDDDPTGGKVVWFEL